MSAIDHRFDNSLGSNEDHKSAPQVEKQAWINRYSLRTKLRLAIFGNVVFMGATTLIILGCWLYFLNWGATLGDLFQAERRASEAALSLSDAETAILDFTAEGLEDRRSEIAPALVAARTEMIEGQAWIDNEMPDGSEKLLPVFESKIAGLEVQYQALGGDPTAEQLTVFREDMHSVELELRDYVNKMQAQITQMSTAFYGSLYWALSLAAFLLLIAILATFLGVNTVIRNVIGAIQSLTNVMTRVAGNDVEAHIPGRTREDELGEMARALEVFRTKSLALRDLDESRAKDAEQRLARQRAQNEQAAALRHQTSDLLEGLADSFEVSVGEVIASVSVATEQLRTTSQTMANLSDESAQQALSATAAMESANVNVTAAAAATDEFALSINEISQQASGSAALAREASKVVDAANSQMTTLASAADEIGEIVELIQTIAQRTNLLALNASIEAARGGEAGRGFAVVASEVKELANQTSSATQNVSERIHAIQSSTNASVSALTSIVSQIAELEQSSGVIASAVDQQSLSGEELARNIDVAANGSADVVIRLEKLQAASQETGGAVQEVLGSAQEMGRLAEEMRGKAGAFISEVRNSARDLAVNDTGSDPATAAAGSTKAQAQA